MVIHLVVYFGWLVVLDGCCVAWFELGVVVGYCLWLIVCFAVDCLVNSVVIFVSCLFELLYGLDVADLVATGLVDLCCCVSDLFCVMGLLICVGLSGCCVLDGC